MSPAKMSLVNLVKYLTITDPWNMATTKAITTNQIPIQTRHVKKSMLALFALAKLYKASSNNKTGPVTPERKVNLFLKKTFEICEHSCFLHFEVCFLKKKKPDLKIL